MGHGSKTEPRILILAYGNPGRQDDGLGPNAADRIEALGLPNVSVEADYQLNIEDGMALAECDVALFVDASKDTPAPYTLEPVTPAAEIAFTSHSVTPESVLAICEDHFGPAPRAWTLGIRGYEWELAEGLTPQAQENLEAAVTFVQSWIRTLEENTDGS